MSCEELKPMITGYLDGELSQQQRERLKNHLLSCESCRRELAELTELKEFYPAEDYHQQYFQNNPNQPYCTAVVAPKVAKARKHFMAKLTTTSES